MTSRTRPTLLAFIAAAACAFLESAAVSAQTSDLLEVSLRSSDERKGDYDALAASWLDALSRDSATRLADLPASRLGGILPFVKDPLALVPALEKAAAAHPDSEDLADRLV